MHDQVGAELERSLQHRGRERVVDRDVRTLVVGGRDDRGQVGDLERRVGRRLHPHQRRVLAGLHHRVGVLDVHPHGRHPAAHLQVVELAEAALVRVPRHHHLLAERDQVEHGGDRCEPARERQAAPALEGAERVLERAPGGVAVAAVLEVAAGDVRRGHRDRGVERLVRLVRRTAGRHREGLGMQGLVGHGTHPREASPPAHGPR